MTDERKMKIYPDIASLMEAERYVEAALVREQSLLIVWGDSKDSCIERALEIQNQMMHPFVEGMKEVLGEKEKEKKEPTASVGRLYGEAYEDGPEGDDWLEENLPQPPRRPVLIQTLQTGITLAMLIAALGNGWRQIVIELLTDHNWMRLAFLIALPLQFWLALVSDVSLSANGEARSRGLSIDSSSSSLS